MGELRAGDWVEVRSKEEILNTLGKDGRLGGLPFMPQMFQYCGQRFQVYKRAHKTCDTVTDTGGRRLPNGIHLDLRCDGKAYGGCQAACLIFWKEEWLKPVNEEAASFGAWSRHGTRAGGLTSVASCTEEDVWRGTRVEDQCTDDEMIYVCQATRLPQFTTYLPWWDLRQYLEDYASGNATLSRILKGFIYVCYYYGSLAYRGRSGRPARWLYDRVQSAWGGIRFPRKQGTIPRGQPTPTSTLNLQPGELVRVKSHEEILATIDAGNMNRGLLFDAELVPFCGGTYRVTSRVSNFIDEKTGKMRTLKTPAVILGHVYCQARYSNCKMFCPRSIFSWWREVWLERVAEKGHKRGSSDLGTS